MLEHGQFWRNKVLRDHTSVVAGEIAPSIVFTNGTYLNMYTKQWEEANIWVYKDRIIYVGKEMPTQTDGTEIVNCLGQYLVPGYIEPHAHPFQLYNPKALALHAGKYGTTTLINDNMRFAYMNDMGEVGRIIEELEKLPVSLFWWGRYDSQSMLLEEADIFNTENILSWMERPSVIQGGELTSWPQLLAGDDRLLYWISETKKMRKRIEGHLPAASEATLTKLKLLGVSGDHEAMSGEDVLKRLRIGYQVALRYSSIRPDLPKMLDEILNEGIGSFDNLMYTTDGSTPSFIEKGLINQCIEIAIRAGVPVIEAYRMATYNVASYYGMDELLGSIAPGRLAHINVLFAKEDPHPLSVLAKGQWVVRDGAVLEQNQQIHWQGDGGNRLNLDWDINEDDLQFSIPIGLDMVNSVIIKPFAIQVDITGEELPADNEDAFLLFVDAKGKWRVNTVIRGYTHKLGGLCSSFSATGDITLIGKRKADMLLAWKRMKEIGGGIVLVHEGEVIYELPLVVGGGMFEGDMEQLIVLESECRELLKEYGFAYDDPVYSLLFLASTHLPYVRVTPFGIVDVMKREVLVPANMR